jgi:hypothetical protein
MPIKVIHDVPGIVPSQDEGMSKYGGPMVMQQRKYDLEQMQGQQNNQNRMNAIGAMQNYNAEPSIGEDDAMLDQEIRGGLYDPDTVRSLRDDQRAMREIMRDRNIDGTQRAQAIDNVRSRMRMTRSTGKVPPMMQQMPPAAVQGKPPMTEAEYFADQKNYDGAYAAARSRLQEGGSPVTEENIHAQMHNDYLTKQKFFQSLRQPQGQMPPQQSAPPVGQLQASYTSPQVFGSPGVLAQGGFSQSGGQQYNPWMVPLIGDSMRTPVAGYPATNRNGSAISHGIALAPGHPDYKAPPTPTNQRDAEGYVIMSDGSRVDPRDKFAMSTGGRGQQSDVKLTHPNGTPKEQKPAKMLEYAAERSLASNGSPMMQGQMQPQQSAGIGSFGGETVFGAQDLLAMPASAPLPGVTTGAVLPGSPMPQQSSQQQPMYPMEAVANSRVDAGYMARPDSGFTGERTFTSADGRSLVGSIVQVNQPTESGGYSVVRIKKKSDNLVYDVPLDRLSQQDQQFVLSGGNADTMYDLANPGRSIGTNLFDPQNPANVAMSTPDPNVVNPQKRTMGEPGGAYGLGQVNYGQSPSGKNVYADIIPGGTMPVARSSSGGRTPEERDADVKRMKDFRNKQSRMTSGAQAPAAATDPALTQLLATMTPSQRRDFSKWLGEEPSRYANRNEIARQQSTEWGDQVSKGQYQKYPGMEARREKQQSTQGQQLLPKGQQPAPQQPATTQPVPGQKPASQQVKPDASNPKIKAELDRVNSGNATKRDREAAIEALRSQGITSDMLEEVDGIVRLKTQPKPSSSEKNSVKPVSPQPTAPPGSSPSAPTGPRRINGQWVLDPLPFRDEPARGAYVKPRSADGSPAKVKPSVAPKQQESPTKLPASSEIPSVASQENADWQDWWSRNIPEFESDGGTSLSTWTSAGDSKKEFKGSVIRISKFTEGTRYASFKDEMGRVYTIDIKLLSEADQNRLKDIYKSGQAKSSRAGK